MKPSDDPRLAACRRFAAQLHALASEIAKGGRHIEFCSVLKSHTYHCQREAPGAIPGTHEIGTVLILSNVGKREALEIIDEQLLQEGD